MRIFVASWFFPPSTSSEGIVTYKLLRNSQFEYDVCSANCDSWSYKHAMPMIANNVRLFPITTSDFDFWIDEAIRIFEREHAEAPYDLIMTRSMPPESIRIGEQLKEKYPELPWIASLADPIAQNPYQIQDMVLKSERFDDGQKSAIMDFLKTGCDNIVEAESPELTYLRSIKEIEDCAVNTADALIFPCETLKNYILGTRRRRYAYVVPHSFDKDLYPAQSNELESSDERVTLSFLGHSDKIRSLKPIVLALNHIAKNNPSVLDKIRIRCIGNVPNDIRDLIFNYYLYNTISIEPSVDYSTSLSIMEKPSWLIHIDADFEMLRDTGGSVFFAGKIADYMGTDNPILGITGKHSPAQYMIDAAGGLCVDPSDIGGIADVLVGIAEGSITREPNYEYRSLYSAQKVARSFDAMLQDLLNPNYRFTRDYWPPVAQSPQKNKLISICVPAYNVEAYLDRCLFSLVSCKYADRLEILVINDGSKDGTAVIARAYEKHYPSIVTAVDKANGGHGSTINTALAKATGSYFRVIDGDDWMDSGSLDALISKIDKDGIDADLISSNYYQVYHEDGHTVPWIKNGSSEDYRAYDFASSDFSMEYFTMAAAMFKTATLREPGFKIQEHTFYVDVEYLLYPIPYTKSVMFTPEYIYRYAVGNADQSINQAAFTKRYDHHDRVIRRMLTYYREHKQSMGEGQREYMKSLFARHLLQSHYTLSLVWDSDRKRGLARAQDFDSFLKDSDIELWKICGKKYPAVRIARRKSFDSARIHKPLSIMKSGRSFKKSIKRQIRRFKQTKLSHKLAKNETLRRMVRKFLPR